MPDSPVAILAADTHLAPRAWAYRDITGDSYFAFQHLVSMACDSGCDLIVAGDVMDRQANRSETVAVLAAALRQLKGAGRRIYYVIGQHDGGDHWGEVDPEVAIHLHKKHADVGGRRVYGLDYQPAGILQEELAKVPKHTDLLVCHQVWLDLQGPLGFPQGSFSDVPHVRLMLTGDYHKHLSKSARGASGQELRVLSPGSTCMQSKDEEQEKRVFVLNADNTICSRGIPARPVLRIPDVLTDGQLEKIVAGLPLQLKAAAAEASDLPGLLRKPLVVVKAAYELRDARRRIAAAIGDAGHLFWGELKPSAAGAADSEKVAALTDARAGDRAATMLSLLEEYMAAQGCLQPLPTMARRLLEAPDIEAELVRLRAEALGA